MDEIQELKKELQQLRIELEVEKQKNTKLQKELEIARRKSGPPATPFTPVTPVTSPKVAVKTPFVDMGEMPVTSDELKRLQNLLDETLVKLDKVEKDKWEVQKKNIELKENLQRLKVQGSNLRKDIETLMEKVDRKENQNFKIRLDLTDLKKELIVGKEDQENQEKILRKLRAQIEETTVQLNKHSDVLKEEQRKRDKITLEYNKARDLLAKYEDHWLAKIYNR
jgi:predicted  nucleic acid-binding Zn-ribbon protein